MDTVATVLLPILSMVLLSAKMLAILVAASRVISLMIFSSACSPIRGKRSLRTGLVRRWLWWVWVALQLQVLLFLSIITTVVVGIWNTTFLSQELELWKLTIYRKLPSRVLSRIVGKVAQIELPNGFLRLAVLRIYVWLFSCKIEEAAENDLRAYSSLLQFFNRTLKAGVRQISPDHPLVSPADGKVLHFGKVENKQVEQVKGVTYQLDKLLGPGAFDEEEQEAPRFANFNSKCGVPVIAPSGGNELFHAIIYLGPGDYHHFHSPTDWNVQMTRHIVGDLLTVAPWAAKLCPGLFVLNERAVLSGYWEHGYFSMTAVGAYNVGSIELEVNKELKTNLEGDEAGNGQVRMGKFTDKLLIESPGGAPMRKGNHMGHFNLGSSIVLVFEAPKEFRFVIEPGERIQYGQALGRLAGQTHMESSDLE